MNTLARLDLNRQLSHVASFTGRAIALGLEFAALAERFEETLGTYLRAQALSSAQRYRAGIAIGRDALQLGVERSFACVDLGLEELSGGDLNRAVDLLAAGDLEALRRRGAQLAYERLEELRSESALLSGMEELALLPDAAHRIRTWSTIVPETWAATDDEGEPVAIDPREDYRAFPAVRSRLHFVRALPRGAVESLLRAHPPVRSFDAVIHRLVLAVALGRDTLHTDVALVERFAAECLEDGRMRPELRSRVIAEIGGYIDATLGGSSLRDLIRDQVLEELERLEQCSPEQLLGHVLPSEMEDDDEDKVEAARAAAAGDRCRWTADDDPLDDEKND